MKLRNVIFYVRDIKKSTKFYKSLGFEIAQDFGDFVSFATDQEDLWLSIMEPDSTEKEPGKQVCAFWVADLDGFYDKVFQKEIKIATKLFDAPFGQTFAINDIDGNKIEFVEKK